MPNGPARSAARPSPAGLTPAELAEYQPLFDNAKKLRALLSELQDLTLEIIEADRRNPSQQNPPNRSRNTPENVGDPA